MQRVGTLSSRARRLATATATVSHACLRIVHGASLIDALVGLAVAMVSLIIVYQAFVAVDTVRRNAGIVADAQSSAAFALFTLASQIGNAGAGWASAARWLDSCPASSEILSTLRPIDVLIADGGSPDHPDSVVVRQSFQHTMAMPAALASAAPAGANLRVQSPDGFAVGDRVVAITRTGACIATQLQAVAAAVAGIVDIAPAGIAIDLPITSVLLDLGPAGRASTLRFDVAAQTLRSTDLANGDAPVPLASNVVNLKFQYGIDSDGDGALDTWVRAEASGPWSQSALLAAPRATLERIKAVRIGIVVRGERPDRGLARDFHWVLFDCEQDDKAACPGRLEGSIAGSTAGSYRYRTLETVVPLHNVNWNRGT
jgi:type IV pilus assembly protein PilW